MSSNKYDFFAFGNNLSDGLKSETVEKMPTVEVTDNGVYTCAVCKAKSNTTLCAKCGFDNSRNYEQYPTLQKIKTRTPAVSLFKALWSPPAEPSVEQTMALLRNQRWDDNVLSAVEKLLSGAKDGNIIEPTHIPTKEIVDRKISEVSPTGKLTRQCSLCGASNNYKNLYCLSCGAKLKTKVNR